MNQRTTPMLLGHPLQRIPRTNVYFTEVHGYTIMASLHADVDERGIVLSWHWDASVRGHGQRVACTGTSLVAVDAPLRKLVDGDRVLRFLPMPPARAAEGTVAA